MNTALTDGSEPPLPCHTHKRKCSWKTGFLLSGTVFVFCLHFQSASGTIDVFTEENRQRVSTLSKHWHPAATPAAGVAVEQHGHCYGWLSTGDPAEPVLMHALDHFTPCMSSHCITTPPGAGEGRKRAEKSRTDAHKCHWLVSDLQPPCRGDASCMVHTTSPWQPGGCSCTIKLNRSQFQNIHEALVLIFNVL